MPARMNPNLVVISPVITKTQNKFLESQVKMRLKEGISQVSKSSIIREALTLYMEKNQFGEV
jgi:hypothetical protein